jgi:integrase
MSDGTGRIYQRGNVWWIDYGFRGDRHRESSKSTKKGVAVKLLKKRMAEMGRGQLVGPDEERLMFADLKRIVTDDYKMRGNRSTDRLRVSFLHLEEHLGHRRALDMTTDVLTRYVVTRQEEGAANSSIKKELAALRRAFNLARRAGRLTTVPPFPCVKVDNVREGFFDRETLEAVCAHLDVDVEPVVRFAFLTAWRKREILNLQWKQVDWEAGTVRLEPGTTKNGKGREFPFAALPELEELLRHQRERTDAVARAEGRIVPHVFHRSGEPIKDFRYQWQDAAKAAGHPGAWFHDLRRSAVRNFERAGISRSVAMKLSGHKTQAVYERYAIADSVALEEGVAKLARLESHG